ncbi:hypothetical protein [Micromonospora sp. WMMA1947]|uniref:hypothetical protein n=1 Tax=Micromonospora sp. WMMA1947 TaxID=3015163 RepID=UPI00248B62D3|nr:hypothetical protein [Micromonospora sp. WMMA1947]WBC08707.1 hypothetical protein O7604_26300 [Micromonospora sp. WMMA1947]
MSFIVKPACSSAQRAPGDGADPARKWTLCALHDTQDLQCDHLLQRISASRTRAAHDKGERSDPRQGGALMITGYDTVFITGAPVDAGIRVMLDDLHARWPNVLVALGGEHVGQFRPWRTTRAQMPAGAGEVYVARDAEMERRWDDLGYSLSEHAEGPSAVLYEFASQPAVEIQLNEDPSREKGSRHRSMPGDVGHRRLVAGHHRYAGRGQPLQPRVAPRAQTGADRSGTELIFPLRPTAGHPHLSQSVRVASREPFTSRRLPCGPLASAAS